MELNPICKISAGIDVHLKLLVVTVQEEDASGNILEETREYSSLNSDLCELSNWLAERKVEIAVLESTGVYWKSTYEALESQGIKAYVVNAKNVKQIPGKKTDVKDSQWLATLGRYGLVKGSFIPEKRLRDLRLMVRYRCKLQNNLTAEVNRMHKILNDAGIRLGFVCTDIKSVSAISVIDGLIEGRDIEALVKMLKGKTKKKETELRDTLSHGIDECHKFLLQSIRDHIKYLQQQCKKLEDAIFDQMKYYQEQWEILQTIPGVDKLSAAMIISETGVDMQQFETSEKLCAWAGVAPGNNESAGKRKSGKTTKGSCVLGRVLCEVANAATKTRSQFKGFYSSLRIRKGHKKTIIASAHKILRVVFKLLSTNCPYQDPDIDYEQMLVKKNAPRWINALVKFGYLKNPQAA